MELHITLEGRNNLISQLYNQLREGIDSGRLSAGSQLPPSRLLAERLGISRKTVAEVYARLTYDNLLIGQVGKGTFVNARAASTRPTVHDDQLAGRAVLRQWRNARMPMTQMLHESVLSHDFIGGATSKNQFPEADWRRCVLHALRQTGKARGVYSQPEGLPTLRDAVARHIGFARGVRCGAEDLVISNGAQQALDLISRVLIEPGCTVAVEEPGYPPARLLFAALGAQVVGVGVDEQGIKVADIPDGTRLIYVTPSHQFPLGMPMSLARRHALLARALELGAIIIEDDYDCEFLYEGRPTPCLQSLDQHGLVAYVGTFSKTMLPELRLGYLVAPPAILKAVIAAKELVDRHTATLTQWALAKFINDGPHLKHIRRCHELYAGRRERIIEHFNGPLSRWFELVPATAGFHLAALCKQPLDVDQLITMARKVDVGVYSLATFAHFLPARPGLLLGYGAIETLDIDIGLGRLLEILQRLD